jgi:hypothetical protein
MALQEVSGKCGTTLIVVPSNILVQVRVQGKRVGVRVYEEGFRTEKT